MDHITQLYQNRAKVLQEEVTRLEALLEAMVDAPPISVSSGWSKEKAAREQRIQDQQAAADTAEALAKAEKDKEAKAIAEHPIGAPIVIGTKSAVEAIGKIGNVLDNPYFQLGVAGLGLAAGYGLASTRLIPGAPANKMASSIFYTHKWDMGVNPKTGLPDTTFSQVSPKGTRSIRTDPLRFRGALLDRIVSRIGKGKGLEQEIASAKAVEDAKIAAEKSEASLTRTQKKLISRNAENIQPGEIGPEGQVLRDPNLKIGEKGSMKDAGIDLVRERVKAATETQSGVKGGRLTAGAEKMLRQKNSPFLRSIGTITPEDIELLGQGAKDLAMTGKEVAGKVGRAATRPLPGSSSALATGLVQTGVGLAGELAGEYVVKPAAEKIGLTDLVAKGISAVVPNSILAAGNSPAEDERADEEMSNNLTRAGIRSGRLRGPMGIDIGKK